MGQGLNRLVFQPPTPSYGNDPNLLWLQTKRREMIPAFHVFRSSSRQTILFSHGNAEDLGMIVNYFKEIAEAWDVNIFAYEYTGYGMSSGVPSEQNVYADIEAAYEYLTKKFKVPWQKIVLYGRSLGTGASVHLASSFPIRGMILQSGLLSIHRVGLNLRLTLPGDMFCNIDKISKVKCPVFVIHGVKDEIVPFSHGMQLYNACPAAVTPYWLEDAGHNNIELTGQTEFVENVSRFLKFLELHPPDAAPERLPKFELYKDHAKFLRHFVGTASSLQLQPPSDAGGTVVPNARRRTSVKNLNGIKRPSIPKPMESPSRRTSIKRSKHPMNSSEGRLAITLPDGQQQSRSKLKDAVSSSACIPDHHSNVQRNNKANTEYREIAKQQSKSSSVITLLPNARHDSHIPPSSPFSHLSQSYFSAAIAPDLLRSTCAVSTTPSVSPRTPQKLPMKERRRSTLRKTQMKRFHDCCGGESSKRGHFTDSEKESDNDAETSSPSTSNQTSSWMDEAKEVIRRHHERNKTNNQGGRNRRSYELSRMNDSGTPGLRRVHKRAEKTEGVNAKGQRQKDSKQLDLSSHREEAISSFYQSFSLPLDYRNSRQDRRRIVIPVSKIAQMDIKESRKHRHRQIKERSHHADRTANIPHDRGERSTQTTSPVPTTSTVPTASSRSPRSPRSSRIHSPRHQSRSHRSKNVSFETRTGQKSRRSVSPIIVPNHNSHKSSSTIAHKAKSAKVNQYHSIFRQSVDTPHSIDSDQRHRHQHHSFH